MRDPRNPDVLPTFLRLIPKRHRLHPQFFPMVSDAEAAGTALATGRARRPDRVRAPGSPAVRTGARRPQGWTDRMLRRMQLSPECARVLGALVEKGLTTPQQYPLTLNALQAACNQTSNREPVVSYDETTVQAALDELKDQRLVRFVLPSHGRSVVRYRHVLDEALGLDDRQCAILAMLLLRGPQTVGELRIRTERMAQFDGLDEVEHELDLLGLTRRAPRRQRRAGGRARRRSAGPRRWSPRRRPSARTAAERTTPTAPARSGPRSANGRAAIPRRGTLTDDAARAELAELRAEVAQLREELAGSCGTASGADAAPTAGVT